MQKLLKFGEWSVANDTQEDSEYRQVLISRILDHVQPENDELRHDLFSLDTDF
jgi:hypothetical protein